MTGRSISRTRSTRSEGDDPALDFAPESYWPTHGEAIKNPTNELSRRIEHAIDTGDWSDVKPPPTAFGSRGGDYLPPFKRKEVEIARLSLDSTTWDVISIRARPTSRGIAYRVVDEYNSEYSFRPKSSRRPLSLSDLISIINDLKVGDQSSSPCAIRDRQGDLDDEESIMRGRDFVIATSTIYLGLEPWFREDAELWMKKELANLPTRLERVKTELQDRQAHISLAAREGDPTAMMRLGCSLFFGRGIEKNQRSAVELWERASALGESRATFNLAVCLQDGYGVEKDETRALALYEQLATQGYYVGLKQAAYCRLVGVGCEPDNLKSLHWCFEWAKRDGPSRFAEGLVKCLKRGPGTTQLEKDARAWIESAAAESLAGVNMVRSLGEVGTPELPPRYGAGTGYIGEDSLVMAGWDRHPKNQG